MSKAGYIPVMPLYHRIFIMVFSITAEWNFIYVMSGGRKLSRRSDVFVAGQ